MHPYLGHPGPRRPPLVLGHEAVVRVPGREGRFAVFPLVSCGECAACLAGRENLCARRGLLGLDRQGAFAERVAAPADALIPVPDGLDDRLAALVEPLATPLAALEENPPAPGEAVAVVGCGPIGLTAIHVCASKGIPVVAADPVEHRRELAVRLGAQEALADAAELEAGAYGVVLDAVGFEPTWTASVAAARSGGTVVVVGLGQAQGAMPVGDLVRRGVAVKGHYAYTRAQFVAALELLAAHPVPLDWIDVMPLDAGAEAFARLAARGGATTKVMLRPATEENAR
jgi:threonine dehydrogenase-like Zn-dependent dehydrogenase